MAQNKVLSLSLISFWFEMIKSGRKTVEYRRYCHYWNKRFMNNQYDIVIFHKGCSKKTVAFKINKIELLENKPNDLNEPLVWAIELGERI